MCDVSGSPTVVRRLDDTSEARWDQFVDNCSSATFFHRAGWKRVIERSFGHQCHFLYVENEGIVRGVLPLVHVKSRLFANALISIAFCVYGGPVTIDDAGRSALERAALALAELLQVDYLEFRLLGGLDDAHSDWARNSDLYVTFRKALAADPEQNFRTIPRKQRAMVRKGMRLGLSSELDGSVERFYPIYAESVRNLGTPVFAKRFFENLFKEFGRACDVLTVTNQGRAVSSVMSFYFRDEVLPYYGGGTLEARNVSAYDFLYWELMRRACERGYSIFDFGRSKRDTGSYAFKRHWGFEPEALHYRFKLLRQKDIPMFNPLNPKYRMLVALWKRMPLPLANLIGPYISRDLG